VGKFVWYSSPGIHLRPLYTYLRLWFSFMQFRRRRRQAANDTFLMWAGKYSVKSSAKYSITLLFRICHSMWCRLYTGMTARIVKTLFQLCTVFVCFAKVHDWTHECLYTPSGEDYIGRLSHTISGIPCQRWSDKSPHEHAYDDIKYFADYSTNPAAIIHDVTNYCRNPSVLSSADSHPWCFTTNENVEKEYCDIPRCKSKLLRYK